MSRLPVVTFTVAALKAAYEGEDKEEAAKAKKALQALGEVEPDEDDKKKEEPKEEAPAKEDGDDEEKKEEEPKASAPSASVSARSAATAASVDVVAEVIRLSGQVEELRTRDERNPRFAHASRNGRSIRFVNSSPPSNAPRPRNSPPSRTSNRREAPGKRASADRSFPPTRPRRCEKRWD